MYTSFLGATNESESEIPPRTGLPWVWIGFIFALIFFFAEFIYFIPDLQTEAFEGAFILIVIAAMAYWLFCVHRFHKILKEMSQDRYPIEPGEAVWKHFIPILNLIWIFQWPSAMSDYINARGKVRMLSGKLIGLFLLLSVLLRFVDGAVGIAVTFAVGMYISYKLRRHIELVKGTPVDMLPPPPDKDLFGYAPQQAAETQSSQQ